MLPMSAWAALFAQRSNENDLLQHSGGMMARAKRMPKVVYLCKCVGYKYTSKKDAWADCPETQAARDAEEGLCRNCPGATKYIREDK